MNGPFGVGNQLDSLSASGDSHAMMIWHDDLRATGGTDRTLRGGDRAYIPRETAKRTTRAALLMTFILAAPLLASQPQQQPSAEPKVLVDGVGATFRRVDNMHQVRFIEIFLAGREAKTGNMVAACHNTMFTTWIMKGFQLGLEPRYSYEEFVSAAAGKFKTLPRGWKVRVKTLDRDLVETPESGVATIQPGYFTPTQRTGTAPS